MAKAMAMPTANASMASKFRPSAYKISTITATGTLNVAINLDGFYQQVDIIDNNAKETEGISYIEYGRKGGQIYFKGYHKKMKKRKQSTKRFNNQMTIVFRVYDATTQLFHDINCKFFQNGNIQMTGLKYIDHGMTVMRRIKDFIPSQFIDGKIEPSNYNIRLINCDFRTGCEIKREKLCNLMQTTNDIFCNYEPCIYPGVKIQYNYNTLTTNKNDGICTCNEMCNGKGNGCGDGKCKKVTIAVFQSGCVIITGGQSLVQVNAAYDFICKTLGENIDNVIRLPQLKQ